MLAQMCSALEHRGPDSSGAHLGPGVGLGIRRLKIIDLDTGDQPLYNEDRSVVVVLNGEIYNYRELRVQLQASGHIFSTQSDTEVIVHLYEEHGTDCVDYLHGMFAFAVWDEPRRQLMLARDRVGKKPLFYAHRGGDLSFASELNAVMQDPEVSREIDPRALDAYFALRYIPAPMSVYRSVRKLPPASVLTFRQGKLQVRRYWSLRFAPKRKFASNAELDHELREQVRAATRRRMVSDVPLGAFVSGGIDSSAVVAAMAEVSPQPVKTFSIGFATKTPALNELPYARRIAEQFSTDHEEFVVEPDAVHIIRSIARSYGEPFGDPTAIPSFYLAALARPFVTVALNGDGGDESFAGYQRYVANLLLHRLDFAPAAVRRGVGRIGQRLPTHSRINSPLSRLRRLAIALGEEAAGERYVAYSTYLDGLARDRLYTPEFREQVEPSELPAVLLDPWSQSSAEDLLDRLLDVDVNVYLPGDLLTKMDIATMSHSLEARSPLLDHQLMEFAAALPAEAKVSGTHTKVAFRRAFRGWIPDDILDRPKQGFELPIADWLRGDLGGFAREVLLDPAAERRGTFEPAYVEGLLDRHIVGAEDNASRIWTLLMFELWYQEVADHAGPREDGFRFERLVGQET